MLAALARRHGTTAEKARPVASGAASHVFRLGDAMVPCIPRTRRFLLDLVREAAVLSGVLWLVAVFIRGTLRGER
ncbi:hypothetical protein [Streptomyces sp. NPDC057257]|uniref:hypothetical protein n=1 Tax=Streptomyces sp. NPDC057257 TaxID=3346071 RepID=UPI00362B9FB0